MAVGRRHCGGCGGGGHHGASSANRITYRPDGIERPWWQASALLRLHRGQGPKVVQDGRESLAGRCRRFRYVAATAYHRFTVVRRMWPVQQDLIAYNPFDRLVGTARETDKDWPNVTLDEFEQLLAACKNIGWSAFLGLQRLSELRRGEALASSWIDVNWEKIRLTVIAQKTGSPDRPDATSCHPHGVCRRDPAVGRIAIPDVLCRLQPARARGHPDGRFRGWS